MYGIFPYIYHKNQPNVGVYTSPMDPMGLGRFPRGLRLGFQETPGQEVDQLGALGEMAKGGKVGIGIVGEVFFGWLGLRKRSEITRVI